MEEIENIGRKSRRPLWIILIIVVLLFAACCGAVVLYLNTNMFLELSGEPSVTLEYGEDYKLADVTASIWGKEVDARIDVDQPEMNALGTYTVTYTATFEGYTASVTQIVVVIDTRKPEITLNYVDDHYTEPGHEYEEEGFSAWDEVDGDLTDSVERSVEDGVVTYTVTDASGNTNTVTREILYDDRTPPELTLVGDKIITITAGSEFTEPGYSASDNVDGDITANVTVIGDYDINVPGMYTIQYSVTDSYGNTATASRSLNVEKAPEPEAEDPEKEPEKEPAKEPEKETSPYVDDSYLEGVGLVNDPENPGKKIIYLTFDDGPGSYTPQLLDILEKYNVKVTFFVVGSANLEYLDDIAAAGHSIGIHSNTHTYSKIYASEEAFFNDFYALYDKIYELTGIETKLHRFPGGSSNTISKNYCRGIMSKLVKAVEEDGFQYFDWNVDSKDAGGAATAAEVYNNVVSGIKGKKAAVVLQHDIKSYSVAAVEKIIQWGLANGYTFLPLDENSPTVHHGVNN